MKVCSKCGIEKSVEGFHRSKKSKDGLQSACKLCQKKRLSSPENMERRQKAAWAGCLKKFGITEDDYNKMFNEQMGLCAICHKPDSIRLAVDHDHDTGLIRGLLCKKCNMGIGLLSDDPNTLVNAVFYLKGKK